MGEGETMRRNGPMALLLAVLAFLGLRSFTPDLSVPLGEKSNTSMESMPPERDEKSDQTSGENNGADRFWEPLIELQKVKPADGLVEEIEKLSDLRGQDTACIIACLPDPIDSTSGYRFDGLIDTIQRAAETQDYVLDRYYYPRRWQKKSSKKTPNVISDESSARSKGSSRQGEWKIENVPKELPRQPGLLVFRGLQTLEGVPAMTPRRRLLLVFLVGEMATAGIDKVAFTTALLFLKQLQAYSPRDPVRVLGPHFSGSQASLELVIQAWAKLEGKNAKNTPGFRVISGDATSINREQLKRNCHPADVSFEATVAPDAAVVNALCEYLNLRWSEGHFAVLCESNTSFGQRNAVRAGPTFFPFPLHISEVRDAYDKTTGATKNNMVRLPSFSSKLQLSLREDRRPHDVEPSLDPTMTAVTTERLLAHMLETIHRGRFPYVFIVATDVKDQLFLSSLVRQQCPASRVVFTYSDLLFSHPDFSADLRGSIVGSTYPLYARNQRWSFPFKGAKTRFFFPGPGEQGYFNATIALLNENDSNSFLEYGPPFPSLYSQHYPNLLSPGTANETNAEKLNDAAIDPYRPPVWISIIGQSEVYPLAVIPAKRATEENGAKEFDSYDGYVYRPPHLPPSGDIESHAVFVPARPSLLTVTVLMWILLLLYVSLSYFAAAIGPPTSRQKAFGPIQKVSRVVQRLSRPMQKMFRPRRSAWLQRSQRIYTFVCLLSVWVGSLSLAFVCLLPYRYSSLLYFNTWWQEIPPCSLGLLVLLSPVLWVVRIDRDDRPTPSRFRGRFRCHLALGYLELILTISSLLILSSLLLPVIGSGGRWLSGENFLLFAERATILGSGVSPVAPILMIGLALFCWSYVQLKRLYLLAFHTVKMPFPLGQRQLFDKVRKRHRDTEWNLRTPARALGKKSAFIVGGMLIFVFLRAFSSFPPASEWVWLERVMLLALAALAVVIVYGWLHLLQVWENVRRLLDALALLPPSLQEAFGRLPEAVTGMLGPYLSSLRPGRRELLSKQLELRDVLVGEYKCISYELLQALSVTKQEEVAIAAAFSAQARPRAKPAESKRVLNETARACLCMLHYIWRDSGRQALASADPAICPWLERATDFVALEITAYLSQFFVHLRNLGLFLFFAPLLFLLAVNSYPFQPQRSLVLFAVSLICLVMLAMIGIVIQVEWNGVVSRILKTTPNQLNFHWGFLSRLGFYALPLLSVPVALSSDLSDLIHDWVDPLLQVLR